MRATISGVGVWGPGFYNFEQFKHVSVNGVSPETEILLPKPDRIPSRERRRAPLLVKLAVEVADQACTRAGFDPALAQCVFSSGIGDADTTDYMCRVLAGPDKQLSPTKFHNSVHNAAAGYWSISAECEMPATFVGGMRNSFSMALFEAMIQITTTDVPVLLVMTDLPVPKPLWDMHSISNAFGCAFLLLPPARVPPASEHRLPPTSENRLPPESENSRARQLSLVTAVAEDSSDDDSSWPLIGVGSLKDLYQSSPSAKALCMLEALATNGETVLKLPLSEGLHAQLVISAASELNDRQKVSSTDSNLVDGHIDNAVLQVQANSVE